MLSDRRNFRLLLEVGVAESNGVVSIVGKYSEITVSVYAQLRTNISYGEKTTNRCQIDKISMIIIGNRCC